jgi:hypothetical protein
MNCCGETVKMGVPARHREPARSGKAGGPPGDRPALPRDWTRTVPERYVAGCDTRGRPASCSKSLQLGEKEGHIHGRSHARA